MEPIGFPVPEEVALLNPFLTLEAAVWVGPGMEYRLDLDTGAFTQTPLPADVVAISSVITNGGTAGTVDTNGSIFLTPDPRLATPGSGFIGGVAKRDPGGRWSVVSEEPISASTLVFADDGLYGVGADFQIRLLAE